MPDSAQSLHTVVPTTSRYLPSFCADCPPERLVETLTARADAWRQTPWLLDLARIELSAYRLRNDPPPLPENSESRCVNPTLELIEVQWQGLVDFLTGVDRDPRPGHELILVFLRPSDRQVCLLPASGHDLLALKLVSEGIDSRQAAREGGVTVGVIDDIIYSATHRGLLLPPRSRLCRDPDFPRGKIHDPRWYTSPTFTLQWHITQACDLHCRHCYDRSNRATLELDEGIRILDDLYDFCRQMNVYTQVTFTGGNPLLHPHFTTLYREAAERGFLTAILGNPMPAHRIREMVEIRAPEFYQVSLEGLREHNDYIRGRGHFDRVLDFLDLLREMGIYSMVMLTLTRANLDQVLELAEILKDRADLFTFNRLAMVGEGASLAPVDPEQYPDFLESFLAASRNNPHLSLKDNFFNLLRYRLGEELGGGCAGYGCGAAFNFVSLLPDGEVHACRKLPSPIGHIGRESFAEIYHGPEAARYRAGSRSCRKCEIRPLCGGCPAVSYGFGRDIFTDPDPYCFR